MWINHKITIKTIASTHSLTRTARKRKHIVHGSDRKWSGQFTHAQWIRWKTAGKIGDKEVIVATTATNITKQAEYVCQMAGSFHLANALKFNHYERYILIAMNNVSFDASLQCMGQIIEIPFSPSLPWLFLFANKRTLRTACSMAYNVHICVYIVFLVPCVFVCDVLNEASKAGTKSHRDKFIVEHLVPPPHNDNLWLSFFLFIAIDYNELPPQNWIVELKCIKTNMPKWNSINDTVAFYIRTAHTNFKPNGPFYL